MDARVAAVFVSRRLAVVLLVGVAMGGALGERTRDVDAAGAAARLSEVAADGGPVEVILVVRGTIRPVDGSKGTRWRMRLDSDHVLTFRAEWVVATRPAGRGPSE